RADKLRIYLSAGEDESSVAQLDHRAILSSAWGLSRDGYPSITFWDGRVRRFNLIMHAWKHGPDISLFGTNRPAGATWTLREDGVPVFYVKDERDRYRLFGTLDGHGRPIVQSGAHANE